MRLESFPTVDEWVEARRVGDRISASVAGVILGLSPHRRPWDEWAARKRPDLIEPHDAETLKAFAVGHAAEDYALRLLAIETGETITTWPQQTIAVADGIPWLTCTPDATDTSGEPIEAKHWRGFVSWPPDGDLTLASDFPRLDWLAQLTIQIVILGAESGRLVVLDSRGQIHTYRLHVDADTMAALISRLDAWRTAYLLGDAEPPADAASDAWRLSITSAPKPAGDTIDADDDTAAAVAEWAAARAALASAAAREEAAKAAVMERVADVPGVRVGSATVSWSQRAGSERVLGLGEIRKAAPDLAAALEDRGLVSPPKPFRVLTARKIETLIENTQQESAP